nr:hypothetical protein [uncultured Nocardioides sp.]
MIAWIGIRPSAMSCPPARRAAEANGAAHRLDGAVGVLGEDQDVDDPDRAGLAQGDELRRHLTGEAALSRGKLDDEVVEGGLTLLG